MEWQYCIIFIVILCKCLLSINLIFIVLVKSMEYEYGNDKNKENNEI